MHPWEKEYSAPIINAETQPFWSKAAEGSFYVKRCVNCGEAHWYPRACCPFCFSDEMEWTESKGTGEIYSFSVMRKAARPYIVALVTLDEGPTVLTNLVECEPEHVRIGMRVEATFRQVTDMPVGVAIPVFRLAKPEKENNE